MCTQPSSPECSISQLWLFIQVAGGAFLALQHTSRALASDMLDVVVFVLGTWGDPPTAWRILPAKRYSDNDGPWLVSELQVFASPNCTGDPIPAAKAIQSRN